MWLVALFHGYLLSHVYLVSDSFYFWRKLKKFGIMQGKTNGNNHLWADIKSPCYNPLTRFQFSTQLTN